MKTCLITTCSNPLRKALLEYCFLRNVMQFLQFLQWRNSALDKINIFLYGVMILIPLIFSLSLGCYKSQDEPTPFPYKTTYGTADLTTIASKQDETMSTHTHESQTSMMSASTPMYSDTVPPGEVEDLSILEGDTYLLLSWTNPSDDDFLMIQIRRKTGADFSDHEDGALIAQLDATSYQDRLVVNDETYYYLVFTQDIQGNVSEGVTITATPTNNPPVISIANPTGDLTLFQGQTIAFASTVSNGDPPFSITWNFPESSGIADQNMEDTGAITFFEKGIFPVIVFVADADGDIDYDTIEITVIDHPSCNSIKQYNMDEGDGVYTIDPDSEGPIYPYWVYCDMTNLGGGWTLTLVKDNAVGYIKPQAFFGETFTSEFLFGSFPYPNNHIYYSYTEVQGKELRVTDLDNALDGYFAFSGTATTLHDFFNANCNTAEVSIRSQIGSNWLHLCSSWNEGNDGEAIVYGWTSCVDCGSDLCISSCNYASVNTKNTYITTDSWHQNYGDAQVWIR